MPLEFEWTSGHPEIKAILDAQIAGAYRWVHHALVPYVRIGPAFTDEPITVSASPWLQLSTGPRTLQGVHATMDFAIVFQGTGVRLVELSLLPLSQKIAQKALDAMATGTKTEEPPGDE